MDHTCPCGPPGRREPKQSPSSLLKHAQWVAGDPFARCLGVELLHVAPGIGVVAMTVREDMLNSHDTAHGGAIFSLADQAFAVASNSHGHADPEFGLAVALEISINYVAPARAGDRLTAEAREESQGRKVGVYRLKVTKEDGTLVALAQATAYRKNQTPAVGERHSQEPPPQ